MQRYKAAEPRLEQFCRCDEWRLRVDSKTHLTLPVGTENNAEAHCSVQPIPPKISPLFVQPSGAGQLVSRCTSVTVSRNRTDYVVVEQSLPAELRRQGAVLGLCSASVGSSVDSSVSPSLNPSVSSSVSSSVNTSVNTSVSSSVNPSTNPSVSPSLNPSVNTSVNTSANTSLNTSVNPSAKEAPLKEGTEKPPKREGKEKTPALGPSEKREFCESRGGAKERE